MAYSNVSYGNNIGNISNLQGCKPGKYAVRFADQGFAFFAQPDDFYQGHVNMPGAYGIALIRIATTPELRDQRVANEHQDRVKLSTIPIQRPFTTPALDLSIFSTHGFFVFDTVTTEQAVLRLTAKLATHNQSPVLEDRRRIAQLLSKARIEPSRLETCSASSLSEASRYAKGQVVESMKAPRGMQHHGQGWSSPFPDFVGNYGSSYAGRFVIARGGYLALTRDQSVYPSRAEPLFLEPKKALILRFSRRPTLVKHGFWSLTAYNDDQYLVPNRLRRFCLGDRNILRFPDGTPLSRKAKDGPFEILLQPADLLPPEEWMDNWLPVPEGGGKFSITLRWYGPTEELLSNDYVYPELKTIDAILQANGSML